MSNRVDAPKWVRLVLPTLLAVGLVGCADSPCAARPLGPQPDSAPELHPGPGQIGIMPPNEIPQPIICVEVTETMGIPSWATATEMPTEVATAVGTQGIVDEATPHGATPEIYVGVTPMPTATNEPLPVVNIIHTNSFASVPAEGDNSGQEGDLLYLVENTDEGPVYVRIVQQDVEKDPDGPLEAGEMSAEAIIAVKKTADLAVDDQAVLTFTNEQGETITIRGNVVDQEAVLKRLEVMGGQNAQFYYLKQTSDENGGDPTIERRTVEIDTAIKGVEMGMNSREALVRVFLEEGLTPAEIASLKFIHFGSTAEGFGMAYVSDVETAIILDPEAQAMPGLSLEIDRILRDPEARANILEYSGIVDSKFTGMHVLEILTDDDLNALFTTIHKLDLWEAGTAGPGGFIHWERAAQGLSLLALNMVMAIPVIRNDNQPATVVRESQTIESGGEGSRRRGLALTRLREELPKLQSEKKGLRHDLRRGNPNRLWAHGGLAEFTDLPEFVLAEMAAIAICEATTNPITRTKQLEKVGISLQGSKDLFKKVFDGAHTGRLVLSPDENLRALLLRDIAEKYPDLFKRLADAYTA